MITKKIWTIISVFMVAMSMSASAATLFDDNFESYTDSAAFQAAYTSVTGTGGTDNVPPTLGTDPGQGAQGSNKFLVLNLNSSISMDKNLIGNASAIPGASPNDIVLSYYAKVPDWGNSRIGVSLRSANASSTILNIGSYNNATSNDAGTANKYVARIVGFPGNPNTANSAYYTVLNGANRSSTGWVKLGISANTGAIRFFIDDVESTADAITQITAAPGTVITKVRIGLGVSPNKAGSLDSIVVTGPSSTVNDWNMY